MVEIVPPKPIISESHWLVTKTITGISVMIRLRPCISLHASTGVEATSHQLARMFSTPHADACMKNARERLRAGYW